MTGDEPRDVCPFDECLNDCAVYELDGTPVACVDHFDRVLDRLEAIAIDRTAREWLPPLYEVQP